MGVMVRSPVHLAVDEHTKQREKKNTTTHTHNRQTG